MDFHEAVEVVKQRFAHPPSESPELAMVRLLQACAADTRCAGAGMSLMTESGARAVLAATDDTALQLEQIQFNFGEGPCTRSVTTQAPVICPDLAATSGAWSVFTAGAVSLGVRAVFAFPMRAADTHLGALELYRTTPGQLTPDELFNASVYAQAALDLLLRSEAGPEFERLFPYLTRAIDDRIEVFYAMGMVAVQARVTPDDALSLIRAYAFAHFQTVLELSLHIVDGTVSLEQK